MTPTKIEELFTRAIALLPDLLGVTRLHKIVQANNAVIVQLTVIMTTPGDTFGDSIESAFVSGDLLGLDDRRGLTYAFVRLGGMYRILISKVVGRALSKAIAHAAIASTASTENKEG